ncbi:MAG: PD-(D/E)XK motif protein [Bacteroidales bacterium]
MTKIDNIWTDLENDDTFRSGILLKRYSASVLPNIYVALRAPEKLRCIAAHIDKENAPVVENWNKLKDIKVEVLKDDRNHTKSYLLVLILNQQHKDIFSVLCEDLINQVALILDEKVLIKDLLNRLAKWQTLFERLGQQGMTTEAQRGLFGELYFLKKFLSISADISYCINSWQVPSNTVQDFHHGNWAVEVKTTHGNNHQKIQISSERQLDNSVISNIFLFHISLDIRNNHGVTLNDLVEWVENYLAKDVIELNSFRLKLFEVGYFDIHKPIYQDTGYSIRQESIYKVEGEFPRIMEDEIRNGVGDVKYSIIISDCLTFVRTEIELFKNINLQ